MFLSCANFYVQESNLVGNVPFEHGLPYAKPGNGYVDYSGNFQLQQQSLRIHKHDSSIIILHTYNDKNLDTVFVDGNASAKINVPISSLAIRLVYSPIIFWFSTNISIPEFEVRFVNGGLGSFWNIGTQQLYVLGGMYSGPAKVSGIGVNQYPSFLWEDEWVEYDTVSQTNTSIWGFSMSVGLVKPFHFGDVGLQLTKSKSASFPREHIDLYIQPIVLDDYSLIYHRYLTNKLMISPSILVRTDYHHAVLAGSIGAVFRI